MRKPRILPSSFWFFSGLGLGLVTLGLSHGAVPESVSSAGETRAAKMKAPDLEEDFSRLQQIEKQFIESPAFQKRLKRAARAGEAPRSVR